MMQLVQNLVNCRLKEMRAKRRYIWASAFFLLLGCGLFGQDPVIWVRFANPQFDCAAGTYCVDVEFQSDTPGQELFGMNVRFFYDDEVLEFLDFRDFQGGYTAFNPNPPVIMTGVPTSGQALFNFPAGHASEFVNGAIQLTDGNAPPVVIPVGGWVQIFQMCFEVSDPAPNFANFCPSLVWDLEPDPANGGVLPGDDGVVITLVDQQGVFESTPADETVVQFNWQYSGSQVAPYGMPVESDCISIGCTAELQVFKVDNLNLGGDLTLNAGDQIEYEITVTNTGQITVTEIEISDSNIDQGSLACSSNEPFTLEPGESVTCTAVHTITTDDINAGMVSNSATASGLDPDEDPVTDISDDPDNPINVDTEGDGEPDDPTVTILGVDGCAPLNAVTVLDVTDDAGTVIWVSSNNDPDHAYQLILRQEADNDGLGDGPWAFITDVYYPNGGGPLSYTFTGLVPGAWYQVCVREFCDDDQGVTSFLCTTFQTYATPFTKFVSSVNR
ncbi:MAG: fibronectin type III domain-containing protein, partial [Lewinella sp.]|nr:fibronectin type III domain-containing protein [Lewinella sp.]